METRTRPGLRMDGREKECESELTPRASRLLITVSELDRMRVLPREIDSLKGSYRDGTRDILTSFKLEEKSPS